MSYPADDYESEVSGETCARRAPRRAPGAVGSAPEVRRRPDRAPALLTGPSSARLLGVCPRVSSQPEAGGRVFGAEPRLLQTRAHRACLILLPR